MEKGGGEGGEGEGRGLEVVMNPATMGQERIKCWSESMDG